MSRAAITSGNTALITGGAAGIGLAAAHRFAAAGMAVILVDLREELFSDAEASLRAAGATDVMTASTDVSDRAAVEALRDQVAGRFGSIDVLMCNAGIGAGTEVLGASGNWSRVLDVNLWGAINFCQVFVPGMIAAGGPGLVINTGSKQGITTPPGNLAYNVSKAGVKVFTEGLEHHLRGTQADVTAHLLVPGYVFTDMTRCSQTEKPAGAWTAEQTVDFMLESIAVGDFYILCPDNDVTRDVDEKRIAWAAGDITENRPPLSRWHKDWGDAFEAYVKG